MVYKILICLLVFIALALFSGSYVKHKAGSYVKHKEHIKSSEISVIIPTMARYKTGYQYLIRCLDNLFKSNSRLQHIYVFANRDEIIKLSIPFDRINIIDRPTEDYKELNIFDKSSYDYWRSHLCLDFCYAMTKALTLSDTKYFLWLEDDMLLNNSIENVVNKVQGPLHIAYNGIGATTVIFEREKLKDFIIFCRAKLLEDIPLDWLLVRFYPKIMQFENPGTHIGKISSQSSSKTIISR